MFIFACTGFYTVILTIKVKKKKREEENK
uniref:Uncharacterized protein n=1 Tax=Anguilla anguilla TaxID=7936 RepID=A0A0E9TS13_ANGAN